MKCQSICEPSLCVLLDVHRKICWLAGDFGKHSYAWGTCPLRMNTELRCPGPSCSCAWCFLLSIRDTVLSSDVGEMRGVIHYAEWQRNIQLWRQSVLCWGELRGSRQVIRSDEESSPERPEHHVASWKINSLFFLGLSVILMNLISV